MNQRRQFISDQYHFFAEIIFISIILILPIHLYYDWIPMWSTLIPVIPLCAVFTFLEIKGVDYKRYYFIVPFLFAVFLVIEFPIWLSLLLSLLFIWRYLRIRRLLLIGRETRYIFMTSIFSLIAFYLTNETIAIALPILQLFVLILGYMYSHIAVMERKKRDWLTFRVILYFVVFLSLGGLAAYWSSSQAFIVKAWDNFIYFFFSILGRITYLFQFVSNIGNGNDVEEREEWLVATEPQFNEDGFNIFTIYGLIYLGLYILLSIMCVFVLIPVLRRDTPTHEGTGKKGILRIIKNELNIYDKITRRLKVSRIRDKHPVRMMIHEFERKTIKQKIGRKKSETLNEWFNRIDLPVSVNVYQKVRYGNMNVIDAEVETLKLELEQAMREAMGTGSSARL